jgi:hypothetical protein
MFAPCFTVIEKVCIYVTLFLAYQAQAGMYKRSMFSRSKRYCVYVRTFRARGCCGSLSGDKGVLHESCELSSEPQTLQSPQLALEILDMSRNFSSIANSLLTAFDLLQEKCAREYINFVKKTPPIQNHLVQSTIVLVSLLQRAWLANNRTCLLLKSCVLLLMAGAGLFISPFEVLKAMGETLGILSEMQGQFQTTQMMANSSSMQKSHGRVETLFFAIATQKLIPSNISYYHVYSNPNLTLPGIQEKALYNAPPTWKFKWGARFGDYSVGEIQWLQALEDCPRRTNDASEASIIVVPIPIGATFMWGHQEDRTRAFSHLMECKVLFQQYPKKHVFMHLLKKYLCHSGGCHRISSQS